MSVILRRETMMSLQVFTWHDAVHEAREGARIQFWRFAFAPQYDRAQIFNALRAVFRTYRIKSYIVYEAFGDYDIVLRLWVPRATAPEDLGLAFDDALDALNIYQHEYM